VARLAWAVVVVLALATLAELLDSNYWTTWSEWQVGEASPAVRGLISYGAFIRILTGLEVLAAAVSLAVGFLVAWKRSDDWMGLFVSATLVLTALVHVSSNMDVWRLPPQLGALEPLAAVLPALTMGSILMLFYLFPDGSFAPRWARWPALGGLAVIMTFWLVPMAVEGSAARALEDSLWAVWTSLFLGSIILAVGTQIYRYRRVADAVQRQQMKWVVFGLGLLPATVVFQLLASTVMPAPWVALLGILLFQLAFLIVPVTIALAILRYRLWDIDPVINRTLVLGALTLVVVLLYGLLVGGLAFFMGTQVGWAAAVVAVAAVALMAHPLRVRLQAAANRLMYGDRDDPVAVLRRLGRSMETVADPSAALPVLVETVASSLRLPYVAIELELEEGSEAVARHGQPGAEPVVFPMMHHGQAVGRLVVGRRAPEEAFSLVDERLLGDIARQAGATAHAMRLNADLQRSRLRLVTAREEERRRLRRTLHDGLGPQLATLTLKIDTARNLLARDPAAAEALLVELKAATQAAVADVRSLVYDLRPPALDQLGLVGALRMVAAAVGNGDSGHPPADGLTVEVRAPEELSPLPAAVEVAAYRIVAEAVANTVRHAQASLCTIWLCLDDRLYLAVEDDGVGLPEGVQPGVGLTNMQERAAELGGTCTVGKRPEGGTRVTVVLPMV
jgi:signal transduction histidine kinase